MQHTHIHTHIFTHTSFHSLSLRVMSTASTVTEMLSLLERMSFSTAELSSLLNSPKCMLVNPDRVIHSIQDDHLKQVSHKQAKSRH